MQRKDETPAFIKALADVSLGWGRMYGDLWRLWMHLPLLLRWLLGLLALLGALLNS